MNKFKYLAIENTPNETLIKNKEKSKNRASVIYRTLSVFSHTWNGNVAIGLGDRDRKKIWKSNERTFANSVKLYTYRSKKFKVPQ